MPVLVILSKMELLATRDLVIKEFVNAQCKTWLKEFGISSMILTSIQY
jgi:hypothetical protein